MEENIEKILKECEESLEHCKRIDAEIKAMNEDIEFLQNEYKINKQYFCDEGDPTIDDIIKTVYNFAWASRHNYDLVFQNKK